jgi:hypothetical protein
MQRCRECNEPIVRRSKLPDMCACCYAVLDMDRYVEVDLMCVNSFECEQCKDWGKILERQEPGNPHFLIVVPCPNCTGG